MRPQTAVSARQAEEVPYVKLPGGDYRNMRGRSPGRCEAAPHVRYPALAAGFPFALSDPPLEQSGIFYE